MDVQPHHMGGNSAVFIQQQVALCAGHIAGDRRDLAVNAVGNGEIVGGGVLEVERCTLCHIHTAHRAAVKLQGDVLIDSDGLGGIVQQLHLAVGAGIDGSLEGVVAHAAGGSGDACGISRED